MNCAYPISFSGNRLTRNSTSLRCYGPISTGRIWTRRCRLTGGASGASEGYKMLMKRAVTAGLLLVILIAVLWANGSIPWFTIGGSVAIVLGLYEFYNMVCASGKGKPVTWLGIVLALLFIFQPLTKWSNDGGILLTASVILPLLW